MLGTQASELKSVGTANTGLLAYLYFLVDHWRSICSTNASSRRRELDWRANMVGIFPNTDPASLLPGDGPRIHRHRRSAGSMNREAE